MRLVFACFYEAYPPDSGAASVTYNCAKFAKGERVLVQLAAKDAPAFTTEDGVKIVTLGGRTESRAGKIAGLRPRVERLAETIQRLGPEIVVLEGASWAVFHWLLMKEVRRRLPRAKVVYHSHNVEYVLRRQKHGRMIAAITRWAEARLLREADLVYAVSETDQSQFQELYGVRAELLPNGVDVDRFEHVRDGQAIAKTYDLKGKAVLFMGSYGYEPNREAIDFLADSVMPLVLQQCPAAQLAIIGGKVPYGRPWLVNPGCIHYDQLPAFLKACQVGVAPIFSGSGTRIKILEYMAAGKPVVSTAKGAEGLDVLDGLDILLAEDANAFATAIARLLADDSLSSEVGRRGQETVRVRYSWSILMGAFEGSLRR